MANSLKLKMGSSHKKQGKIADNNAKKSQIFLKLVRLIQAESKKSGGDQNSPGLRVAIERAKKENMSSDTLERAIKKGSEPGTDLQPVIFEAYGPAGIGIIITGLTDNNNRTSQAVKHTLSKNNASLGGPGSVAWNFSKNAEGQWVPNITMEASNEDLEKLSLLIDELDENDDVQDVYTNAK